MVPAATRLDYPSTLIRPVLINMQAETASSSFTFKSFCPNYLTLRWSSYSAADDDSSSSVAAPVEDCHVFLNRTSRRFLVMNVEVSV